MAILSALLSLVARELGTIVQAIFGWSITGLFGKLPSKKQTALSGALALSLFWPLLVLGCFLPAAAAWTIAFVPLHGWLGTTVLRIVWIALAVIVPPAVGAITLWITPREKRTARPAWVVVGGYVMAFGYFLGFVITALTVPIVKIMSAVRKWQDCHVYVQPKEGRYLAVLESLAEASGHANARVVREDVPWVMALASGIVQTLARPFLQPMVALRPQRLRGDALEIYLYPADLLLRGAPHVVAHVRAAMTRTNLEKDAYLVAEPAAQDLQDEAERLWNGLSGLEHDRTRSGLSARLKDLSARLDRAPIAFDEWSILEGVLRRLEQRLSGDADLLATGSDERATSSPRRPPETARGAGPPPS